MCRLTKLDSGLFVVERQNKYGEWVASRYNGADTFPTEEKAEEFLQKLIEIEANRTAYLSIRTEGAPLPGIFEGLII